MNRKYYIAHAADEDIRFRASSGGVGTVVQKYLLATNDYECALTFYYDITSHSYIPKIVYREEDVNVCGSIYQDINVYDFIKEEYAKRKFNSIVLSCPPCMVMPIRSYLDKNKVNSFIISFCCSGQTTIEGTLKFFKFNSIKIDDVIHMQYRGNGWPSGIQIKLKNEECFFFPNWSDLWKLIHMSNLYKPARCLFCLKETSYESEISLGDPWMANYIEKDTVGNTLVLCNNERGLKLIDYLLLSKVLDGEIVDRSIFEQCQHSIINKRNYVKKYKGYLKFVLKLQRSLTYKRIATSSIFMLKIHVKIISLIKKYEKIY